eukprot:gene10405-19105_t
MALAIPTTLLNLALIIAILKTNARKEPSQMLVLNLAFTDFGAVILRFCYDPGAFVGKYKQKQQDLGSKELLKRREAFFLSVDS